MPNSSNRWNDRPRLIRPMPLRSAALPTSSSFSNVCISSTTSTPQQLAMFARSIRSSLRPAVRSVSTSTRAQPTQRFARNALIAASSVAVVGFALSQERSRVYNDSVADGDKVEIKSVLDQPSLKQNLRKGKQEITPLELLTNHLQMTTLLQLRKPQLTLPTQLPRL